MPRPHHPKYPAWSGLPAAQKAAPKVARGSWWVDFAQGERRDEQFMATADQPVPKQSDEGVRLDIWVTE